MARIMLRLQQKKLISYALPSFETYGANVDQIKAPIGAAVTQDKVEEALKGKKYKIVTFTHVDTSTGMFLLLHSKKIVDSDHQIAVLSDAKAIAETVKRVSPDTLVRSLASYS